MNRTVTTGLSALVIGLVAACGSPSDSAGSDDATSEPIKVALIPPSSGALAQFGTDAANGWKLAVQQVNAAGGILGREIELIEKSTDATSDTTLRVAKEAVTRDGAAFIGAVMTSTEHGALNQQLEQLGALSINSLGKDDALVGENCSAYAFHTVQTTTMDINALAASLAELPGERWAIQAVDYSTGHNAAETFTAAAEAAGKEVVLTQFAPLDTSEFGTYITALTEADADALFAVEYGADGVAFVQQAQQFGLVEQFDTILGFNMVSEPLFPALGDVVSGFYNNVGYDRGADNQMNADFTEAYEAEYGEPPYYVPADNYVAAQTLFAGIEAAGSAEPAEVAEALEGLTYDTIVGEVTMRAEDHSLIRPSYLGQVVGAGDDMSFSIVAEASGADITPEPSADCSL